MPRAEDLSVLVYGYGNPGRSDDGLGVRLAERIGKCGFSYVSTDANYQLNAEDALEISKRDVVIFTDASKEDIDSFRMTSVSPSSQIAFTTHAMSAGSVLALSDELYGRMPDTYMLEIKGYVWDMGESLSEKAEKNLESSFQFLSDLLKTNSRELYRKSSD